LATAQEYEEDVFFNYPANIHQIELANLILIYRSRGEVVQASPSNYLCCAMDDVLIKQGKTWFGKTFSQDAWDKMITPYSSGYPLTPYEMHILGYAAFRHEGNAYTKQQVETCLKLSSSFVYVLINDLVNFGFIELQDDQLILTETGDKALHGISRRIFKKRYREEMLPHISGFILPHTKQKNRKGGSATDPKSQVTLF
jgi:hypothetical protein